MNRTIICLLGLIAFVLLIILCIQKHAINIQQDIKKRTVSALSPTANDWVQVQVDGRNVVLTGEAPSSFSSDEVSNIAVKVYGVANVVNQTTVEGQTRSLITPIPYLSQFIKSDSGIILSGSVPDEEHHNLLFQLAEKEYGTGNVTDWMEIGPGAPINWRQAAVSAISNLTLFTEGTADLIDTEINFFGRIIDNQAKKTLEKKLKNSFPDNFDINFDLISTQLTTEDLHLDTKTVITNKFCIEQFQQSIAEETIIFLTGSADLNLNTQEKSILTKVADFSNLCPNYIIKVSGYTDTRGSEAYNLRLSKKRATEIVNILINQGVKADRLRARGYGELNPLSEEMTEQGQENNRRIEFTLIENEN